MKLNNNGYMLVEIVVAAVLAMSVAYFLLDLTYKFKNTNEDLYQSYYYTRDKNLITKNIMSDLEAATVNNISCNTSLITFSLNAGNARALKINGSTIEYGKYDGNFDTGDVSYYKKTLESSLIIDAAKCDYTSNGLSIIIPIESIYDDNDYSIKLFADVQ